MQFVGTLVVAFGMPLEDAWNCTVREFWVMMEIHMIRTGQKKPGQLGSVEDARALEEDLKQRGII
jgi:hypothetical protein